MGGGDTAAGGCVTAAATGANLDEYMIHSTEEISDELHEQSQEILQRMLDHSYCTKTQDAMQKSAATMESASRSLKGKWIVHPWSVIWAFILCAVSLIVMLYAVKEYF